MSIIFSDVDYPSNVKNTVDWGTNFKHVNTDPSYTQHLPCAKEYKFAPCILSAKYCTIADRVHNFTVRPDDVWTLSFPKSGSSWLQEIVWLLKHNLDYDTDIKIRLLERSRLLEAAMLFTADEIENYKEVLSCIDATMDLIDEQQSPRIIKSHLPMNLLPKQLWSVQPKILYLVRNPKDVVTSYFHFLRNIGRYLGSKTEFFELFLNDCIYYAPFHNHALNFWHIRHLKNILFITYEELVTDRFLAIKKISEFLECKYSDEQLLGLTEHVSFAKMRENSAVNHEFELQVNEMILGKKKLDSDFKFLRKGKIGGFRDDMDTDMIKRFDDWTAEKLKGSEFKYAA